MLSDGKRHQGTQNGEGGKGAYIRPEGKEAWGYLGSGRREHRCKGLRRKGALCAPGTPRRREWTGGGFTGEGGRG